MNSRNQQNCGENSSPLLNHFAVWFTISLLSVSCCWPIGIFAVYFGTKVWDAKALGDNQTACENIGKMKLWMWIAICLGILVQITQFAINTFPALLKMK